MPQIKKYDIIIIVLSVAGIILSFIFLHRKAESRILVIHYDNQQKIYSLQDADFEVKSRDGSVKVRVRDGKAKIIESTCPDKWCTRMGKISSPGESIVCLPSKIFLIIQGEDKGRKRKIDAVTK